MNHLQFLVRIQFLLLFQCFFIQPIFGQLVQSDRVEILLNPSLKEEFEVIPLGESGLLSIVYETEYQSSKGYLWQFTKLNTALQQIWKSSYRINRKYTPVMSYITDDIAYWLFAEHGTGMYAILQVNLRDGLVNEFESKLLKNLDIHHFKVQGSKVLVGGYYLSRPIVLVHTLLDQSMKVLPGLYEKNTEIQNIDINQNGEYINVMTYAFRKRKCYFEIKSYSFDGKFLKKTSITDPKYSIISGQVVPLNEESSYLIGNYSIGCTAYSQGIYIANIEDDRPINPQFVEFTDMKNFFNYLKPKRRTKVINRYGKRKSMGKENRLRYRLLVHNLIQTDDEIILVAEIYYPNPSTTSYSYGNIDSRLYSNLRAPDSYRYTHVAICAFDKAGNFKWDNSVAVEDVVSADLQPMIQVTPMDDYFVVAYPHEGKITTSVIKKGEEVVSKDIFELSPTTQRDKFNSSDSQSISPWYANHFIAYGLKDVQSYAPLSTRDVIYISKLSYNVLPQEVK